MITPKKAGGAAPLCVLLAASCGDDGSAVRADGTDPPALETTIAVAPTVERLVLPEPTGLTPSFASDPIGTPGDAPLSFYADAQNPDAGYLHAAWWDEEPAIPDGQTVDIDGREGLIGLGEGVGQLAVPFADGWIFVVSSGLDIGQLEAAGEAAVVGAEEDWTPLAIIEPTGLPDGWTRLDADPLDFNSGVQADDPAPSNAWIVRYDQADPHAGTDLHTGFIVIGQPQNDDLLGALKAVASEYEPIEVREREGVALQLGHLGTTPPLYMHGIAWNEDGQTLLAVGLDRPTSDVTALIETLEAPSAEVWDALTE